MTECLADTNTDRVLRTSSWPVTKTMRPPEMDGCASMELTWCLQACTHESRRSQWAC